MFRFSIGEAVEFNYPVYTFDGYRNPTLYGRIVGREIAYDDGEDYPLIDYRITLDLSRIDNTILACICIYDTEQPFLWVDQEAVRTVECCTVRHMSHKVYREMYDV